MSSFKNKKGDLGYTNVYPSDTLSMMPAKDSGIRIRVEKDLRQAFVQACRRQGLVASSVLRDFMQRYADRNWNEFQGNLFQVSDASANTRRREASR